MGVGLRLETPGWRLLDMLAWGGERGRELGGNWGMAHCVKSSERGCVKAHERDGKHRDLRSSGKIRYEVRGRGVRKGVRKRGGAGRVGGMGGWISAGLV